MPFRSNPFGPCITCCLCIDEVLQLRISQDYFRYLQFHIDRTQQKNTTP